MLLQEAGTDVEATLEVGRHTCQPGQPALAIPRVGGIPGQHSPASVHPLCTPLQFQALASYGLASHAQHLELLQCPGLVPAVMARLQHLAAAATPPPTQHTSPRGAPGMDVESVEAALEALVSLTISQQGLQVCRG